MIEELLPSNVVSVELLGDDPSACLLPEEAAQFGWAVESRRKEFTTARCCARQALTRLGLPATPILRGPNREPLWPPGITGSITHCRGFRAAAAAIQPEIRSLGIDAEIHGELPAGVASHVLVAEEVTWCQRAPLGIHWDRVMFSAKESVYKAWFPLTGKWLGFEDVAITFQPSEGTFVARLLIAPSEIGGRALTAFAGQYLVRQGLVLTATVVS